MHITHHPDHRPVSKYQVIGPGSPTGKSSDSPDSAITFIQKVVLTLSLAFMALLFLRVVLELLGANPAQPLANSIYSLSEPFVAPFYGLFGSETAYGIPRLDIETLVAVFIYGLLAWSVIHLLDILRHDREFVS